MAVVTVVVFAAIALFKKTDEKVEEYKFSRNPEDIVLLEKAAIRFLGKGDMQNAVKTYHHILEKDESNIKANLFLGPYYHPRKNYEVSIPIIKRMVKYILTDSLATKLRFEGDGIQELLLANTYYYYGHILFMEGNFEEANKWKEKARKFNKQVIEQNLY